MLTGFKKKAKKSNYIYIQGSEKFRKVINGYITGKEYNPRDYNCLINYLKQPQSIHLPKKKDIPPKLQTDKTELPVILVVAAKLLTSRIDAY